MAAKALLKKRSFSGGSGLALPAGAKKMRRSVSASAASPAGQSAKMSVMDSWATVEKNKALVLDLAEKRRVMCVTRRCILIVMHVTYHSLRRHMQ